MLAGNTAQYTVTEWMSKNGGERKKPFRTGALNSCFMEDAVACNGQLIVTGWGVRVGVERRVCTPVWDPAALPGWPPLTPLLANGPQFSLKSQLYVAWRHVSSPPALHSSERPAQDWHSAHSAAWPQQSLQGWPKQCPPWGSGWSS